MLPVLYRLARCTCIGLLAPGVLYHTMLKFTPSPRSQCKILIRHVFCVVYTYRQKTLINPRVLLSRSHIPVLRVPRPLIRHRRARDIDDGTATDLCLFLSAPREWHVRGSVPFVYVTRVSAACLFWRAQQAVKRECLLMSHLFRATIASH